MTGGHAPGRRRLLQRAGSTVLLLGLGELAWGATIVAVRVWPATDYSRVTIESDQVLAAHHFTTDGPDRLVVDIDGLELSPALRELVGKVRPEDPYIARVRVGQYKPRVVRLVLDLKQPVLPQQFALPPVAAYRHRLVFDLYPRRERDPLIDLIRERDRADGQAARGMQDALGDFIGRIEQPALPDTPAVAAAPLPAPGPAAPLAAPGASLPAPVPAPMPVPPPIVAMAPPHAPPPAPPPAPLPEPAAAAPRLATHLDGARL
ncbi:AMIN domain-containing protein, partial [Ideonella sp. A 288]|uniref:AMIN domain-containing protein n=1 Tax=Ideonella sp. A 288 TaxID=1962181 RepID=UPI0011862D1E